MNASRLGLLVGIAGSDDTAPLRWASEEAARRHLPVTLVHAVSAMTPPPPSVLLPAEPFMDAGRRVVAKATHEYTSLNADVPPRDTLVKAGRPGPVLSELSVDAELVVVGHRPLGALRRIVTSSTAVSLAANAHTSAVVVPHHWYDDAAIQQRRPWVTVGMHEFAAPAQVLQAAFEAAELRGCGVRLVHAWRPDSVYDDIVMRRVDPLWRQRVEEDMREATRHFLGTGAARELDVMAVHDWPAEALTDISRQSVLLVLGRRSHVDHLPHRLGSIARALVRTAECPVMVVPV